MYYIVFICMFILLIGCIYIIYKDRIEIKKQKDINKDLIKERDILVNIDKHYINYLKNGYIDKSYKGKILLGDYDKFSMSNTISVINKLGYDVDVVNSAEDMLYKLKNNNYDYVITNYMYKVGIDGIELCNKIKNDLKINIPVIILSSTSDKKDEFNSVSDYYVEKPLTQAKLKKILKK